MSALKVSRKSARANATEIPSTPPAPAQPQPNLVALSAAAWQAVLKIAEKECRRDDIPDGASHNVDIVFAAKIDGQIFRQEFSGNLQVGHASVRASSALPSVGVVVATILCELSEKHREALLRRIPEIAAANGGTLPDIDDPGITEAADNMLAKLRQQKPQQVRGSVSAKFTRPRVPLGIFG